MVTVAAFVAVTVNVEEPPGATDVGFATMLTVGEDVPGWTEPQPAASRSKELVITTAMDDSAEPSDRQTRTMIRTSYMQVSDVVGSSKNEINTDRGEPAAGAAPLLNMGVLQMATCCAEICPCLFGLFLPESARCFHRVFLSQNTTDNVNLNLAEKPNLFKSLRSN